MDSRKSTCSSRVVKREVVGKKIGERLFGRLPTLSDQVCYCAYSRQFKVSMHQSTVNCA